ncbi:MAG: helix-turn-helix transcriptional regulator [Acidimicrobiia bacterium]|nr:MAG: helix-turn-helix transcriptional regulator [Acidimicrobiia bacterium]
MATEATGADSGFYEALGRSIQVLRTDRGLKRRELATRAGISYSYLASIENGNKQPSSSVLIAIAEALGLRSHELMAAAEQRQERGPLTTEYPSWLTGDRRPSSQGGPPRAPVARTEGPDLAAFLDEMTDLAAPLDPHEREVLLRLARKLAPRER